MPSASRLISTSEAGLPRIRATVVNSPGGPQRVDEGQQRCTTLEVGRHLRLQCRQPIYESRVEQVNSQSRVVQERSKSSFQGCESLRICLDERAVNIARLPTAANRGAGHFASTAAAMGEPVAWFLYLPGPENPSM